MSYLLTVGKKVQRIAVPSFPPMPIAPAAVPLPVQSDEIPVVTEPTPTPTPEPEPEVESIGASPIPDAELIPDTEAIPSSSEEQCASLPVPASTASSHTEESSE